MSWPRLFILIPCVFVIGWTVDNGNQPSSSQYPLPVPVTTPQSMDLNPTAGEISETETTTDASEGDLDIDDFRACKANGWNSEDWPCPDKFPLELYKDRDDILYDPAIENRYCCDPKHETFKSYRNLANTCRTTSCQVANHPDLCSTIDKRFVKNGTAQLSYEEIFRESCVKDGGEGATGLCCVANSTEGLLVTTLGAEPNEFPHQAKLRGLNHCGGTIYNSKFVITAAHCIVNDATGELVESDTMLVILGSNIGEIEEKEYIYKVKRFFPHPEYSSLKTSPEFTEESPRTFNDIALMELQRDIKFGPKVKALEIAPTGFDPIKYADKSVIVGYGTTDTLDLSANLQKANFLIRSDHSCFLGPDSPYPQMKGFEKQLLCVGGILEGKWSPNAGGGDSGGPAVCRGQDGRALLCGVTSFGTHDDELCWQNDDEDNCTPSVYADVAYFHKWIKEIAGEQDSGTLYRPIVYGETIELAQHEHQVHITSADGKPCGGTLIAPDVVVTAAQCAVKLGSGNSLGNIAITTGLNEVSGKGKSYHQIKGVATAPGFKADGDPLYPENRGNRVFITDVYHTNDLAVIKLQEPTDISPDKFPRLPMQGEKFKVGLEMSFPRNTTYSAKVSQREFKILDKTDCQNRMNRMSRAGFNITIDRNVLCGVERYSGGSLCDRELGGGLICKRESGEDVLCGVQIFRLCELSIPNGFIDMSIYSNWMRRAIAEL